MRRLLCACYVPFEVEIRAMRLLGICGTCLFLGKERKRKVYNVIYNIYPSCLLVYLQLVLTQNFLNDFKNAFLQV